MLLQKRMEKIGTVHRLYDDMVYDVDAHAARIKTFHPFGQIIDMRHTESEEGAKNKCHTTQNSW